MMMVEEEDLGLCLSSSYHQNRNQKPLSKLNLTMMPSSSSSSFNPPINKLSWKYQYGSSPTSDHQNWLDSNAGRGEGTAFMLRGIDVNRLPSTADGEDEAGVSSPNSTVSSLSGKRSERECQDLANCSPAIVSDEEDGETSRKKLRLSKDQSSILEESFKLHNTLNPKQKMALAKQLGLRPRQVEVWFQNRRARTKLKQTEVDCEFLRRCCDNLTEENRRLQREVLELRALKHSPQFYMPMAPPTTLTMCPSCERVAAPPEPSDALRSDRTRPPIAINTRTGPGPGTGPFAYRHSTRDRN